MPLIDGHEFTFPLLFIYCVRLILCVSSVGSCMFDVCPPTHTLTHLTAAPVLLACLSNELFIQIPVVHIPPSCWNVS